MARIVMEIRFRGDDGEEMLAPSTLSFAIHRTLDQCEQISREMHDHFEQVANENPSARAVADALAHPPAEPLRNITIQQDFDLTEPDKVFWNTVRALGSRSGGL